MTGAYLSVTEPPAIYLFKHLLGDRVEIRFVDSRIRSFHPKAYLFDYEQDSEIYVGSSNVSATALTTGIGRLWLKGFIFVGRALLNGRNVIIAAIPVEMREELHKVLVNMQS